MLFRPPDVDLSQADRIAFLGLLLAVLLRICLRREPVFCWSAISIPMIALLLISCVSLMTRPYSAQAWSMLAAKFLVPFALFHVAQLVFDDERSLGRLEGFLVIVLAYLIFIAVAWLCGLRDVVLPRYILDENLGIHADRARGPFLQAVANGVSLNILGLITFSSFRRRSKLLAFLVAVGWPVAVLATMTRAVWFSFAASLLAAPTFSHERKWHRYAASVLVLALGAVVVLSGSGTSLARLSERAEDEGPVEIRLAAYRGSWEMILEKPWLGWGHGQMPAELARRMADYHLNSDWASHNTYLEILGEEGLVGFSLYVWIVVSLLRRQRRNSVRVPAKAGSFESELRALWPVIMGVYLINAFFVVMSYQFVNAVLFTLAGLLAGRNRRAEQCVANVLAS
jgi:putative inorganic carbon (hco3(-)) transporter